MQRFNTTSLGEMEPWRNAIWGNTPTLIQNK